jgi:hypothetical protein
MWYRKLYSQQFKEDESLFSLSLPILCWLEEAHRECLENDTIIQLIQMI